MIAALYVQTNGAYYGLPDVDPWDEARDARKYTGPHPVVAHPPCSRWCQLAHINQKRWGAKVGDDGGCFESALNSVREFGGVLEHPAFSYAWPHFGLQRPARNSWIRSTTDPGWVCEVSQAAYGHRARKLTWLYYYGDMPPFVLDWSRPKPSAQVSYCANHGDSPLPRISKKAASASPVRFRDELLRLARNACFGCSGLMWDECRSCGKSRRDPRCKVGGPHSCLDSCVDWDAFHRMERAR